MIVQNKNAIKLLRIRDIMFRLNLSNRPFHVGKQKNTQILLERQSKQSTRVWIHVCDSTLFERVPSWEINITVLLQITTE